MFNINDMASLRAAYSFVRTLREFTVPVENVVRRDKHIADVKREIREFTHLASTATWSWFNCRKIWTKCIKWSLLTGSVRTAT